MNQPRNTSQETGQYTRHSILRYEKIFGDDYVSTGGEPVVEELCKLLSLKEGMRVLDIGSGLGGAAFYMAKHFGVEVVGVDLSEVMVQIAVERVQERKEKRVRFLMDDFCTMSLEPASFDLVWSRDCFLHIPDKALLAKRMFEVLKPGGVFLITDYARRAGHVSPEYEAYFTKSGYHLLDLESYAGVFREAGFVGVDANNQTPRFLELLHLEMQLLQDKRDVFLKDFSEEDLDYLLKRWKQKVGYCEEGSMVFARVMGHRP